MTSVGGFKKMNWLPKRSAWQEMQLAKQRRQVSAERIDRMNMAASGFQAATTMQIQGVGELAAQTAQSRLHAKVEEMSKKLEESYANISKLA